MSNDIVFAMFVSFFAGAHVTSCLCQSQNNGYIATPTIFGTMISVCMMLFMIYETF